MNTQEAIKKFKLKFEDGQSMEQLRRAKFLATEEKDPNVKTTFIPFNIPATDKPNVQRETLSKILTFVKYMQHLRYKEEATVVPIATTNKFLLSLFKRFDNVQRAIQYMIRMGLIAVYDNTYQFKAFFTEDNKCKKYEWSLDAEKQFLEYCEANGIKPIIVKNAKQHKKIDASSFDRSTVRIGAQQKLDKPEGVSKSEHEDILTLGLEENYPLLRSFFELADDINEKFYAEKPYLNVECKPSFGWNSDNSFVNKIGVRATNSISSLKKEKEEDDTEMSRWEFLEQEGCKFEYEVNSSVPRVIDALNKGRWNSNNEHDFYHDIWIEYAKNRPEDPLPWNEETRDGFKYLFMRCYLNTERGAVTRITSDLRKKEVWDEDDKPDLEKIVQDFKKALEYVLGPSYRYEIFLYESCIYMWVLDILLERGIKVIQVCDGFYTDKEVSDMDKIIERCANVYLVMLGKYTGDSLEDIEELYKLIEKRVPEEYLEKLGKYNKDGFSTSEEDEEAEKAIKAIEKCTNRYSKSLKKHKDDSFTSKDVKSLCKLVVGIVNKYLETLEDEDEE